MTALWAARGQTDEPMRRRRRFAAEADMRPFQLKIRRVDLPESAALRSNQRAERVVPESGRATGRHRFHPNDIDDFLRITELVFRHDQFNVLDLMSAGNTLIRPILHGLALTATFAIGWFAARWVHAGEEAMGSLIETVSAIAYLDKGDQVNALRTLQMSAEGKVVMIARHGTPILDWHEPQARQKWLQRYARIRSANAPIDYGDGGAFMQAVDDALRVPPTTGETPSATPAR